MTAVWAEVEPPCTRHDPELFFPDQYRRPGFNVEGDPPWVAAARRVCARCPVQQACLQTALDNGEDYGIWGGTTPVERRDLLDQRASRVTPGPKARIDPQTVQQLMAQGHSQPQIAVRLGVHVRSVTRVVAKLRQDGPLRPCGTHAAYQAHVHRGEEPCEACKAAEREYNARAKRRQRAGAA